MILVAIWKLVPCRVPRRNVEAQGLAMPQTRSRSRGWEKSVHPGFRGQEVVQVTSNC